MRKSVSDDRRTFLKQTGSIAAGIATFGGLAPSVAASSQTGQSKGTDEAGLTDEVQELLQKGKFEKAKRLLETHGIPYDHDQKSVPSPTNGSSNGVSTQEVFNDETSTFDFFGFPQSPPLYFIELNWDLDPRYPEIDVPGPNDGTGISYSDYRWEFEPQSQNLSEYCENFDPNPQGTIAEWNDYDAYVNNGDTSGRHIILLEKQQSGKHTVYGHYIHSFLKTGGLSSIGFGISIGGLSISTSSGGVSSWKVTPPTIEI